MVESPKKAKTSAFLFFYFIRSLGLGGVRWLFLLERPTPLLRRCAWRFSGAMGVGKSMRRALLLSLLLLLGVLGASSSSESSGSSEASKGSQSSQSSGQSEPHDDMIAAKELFIRYNIPGEPSCSHQRIVCDDNGQITKLFAAPTPQHRHLIFDPHPFTGAFV